MTSYVPWLLIGKLAVLLVPAAVLLMRLGGVAPAVPVVGMIVGLLACATGRRSWAFAAPLVAMAGWILCRLLPLPPDAALYLTALVLSALIVAGRHLGAAGAFAQGTFGWVYLVMAPPGGDMVATLVAFGLASAWGTFTAGWLGVAGLAAPPPTNNRAADPGLFVAIGGGLVLSIAAGLRLDLAFGYWIPFVFLQVAFSANTGHPARAMQRIAGAVLGIFVAVLLGGLVDAEWLRLAAICAALALGLRIAPVHPVLSRALMSAAVVLLVTGTHDTAAAGTRLLAEILGVAAVLAACGIYLLVSWWGGRRSGA